MKAKTKVTGSGKVIADLRNIGVKVAANSRKLMHSRADRIVKGAIARAPVDEHNLEKSIKKVVNYEGPRGRLQIDIEVGGMVDGVDVDKYALQMHYGEYNLGEKSKIKDQSNPADERVGPGFLDRAVEKETEDLEQAMIGVVTEATKN